MRLPGDGDGITLDGVGVIQDGVHEWWLSIGLVAVGIIAGRGDGVTQVVSV
jgi:hypothetical protein